jgi:hypothetical protein
MDLIEDDLKKTFPSEAKEAKVSSRFCVSLISKVIVIEALDHILSMYDKRISEYTESHFLHKNIALLTNSAVKEVKADGVVVARKGREPETIPCALTVWATGLFFAPDFSLITCRNQASSGDSEVPHCYWCRAPDEPASSAHQPASPSDWSQQCLRHR